MSLNLLVSSSKCSFWGYLLMYFKNSKLKIMLSGDKWSSTKGFSIKDNSNLFGKNKNYHLKKYLDKNKIKLHVV